MWVHDLRDAGAACGGKAAQLARLVAAGLPVPPGFALEDGLFRAIVGELAVAELADVGHALAAVAERIAAAELPAELARDVEARAAALGPAVIVRSSATIEDGAAGAAAGVFASHGPIAPDRVWDAIRAVWTSALTALAAAYARRRGGEIAIGVIVQAYEPGERVTIYTRPPGEPARDELVVQRGSAIERRPRTADELAVRAEAAIGARAGADVELVRTGDVWWVVQARPIVHPQPSALVAPPPSVLAPLGDGRRWTWDVAHNPDPLSVAQQGLVERVAELGAWSLRVCAGFLYASPRDGLARPTVATARELADRAGPIERELERLLADPPRELDAAIACYVAFYRRWAGELAPLISAARAVLPATLRARGDRDPDATAATWIAARSSAVEATLAAAARGALALADVEHRLGPLAPAWDVAAATYGEQPGVLAAAVARANRAQLADRATIATLPAPPPDLAAEIALAAAAADLAERDDALFARAQLVVRCALLARAADRGLPDDDIFWLPLDDTSARDDAHRRAGAARAAAARAARWRMPIVVGGEATAAAPRAALRGTGTGARVTGRVVRFATLASAVAVGPGDVVVARAVTPALAVRVVGCAAIVSETGGLLDHGAALARELGVPCVVDCHDAWQRLADGVLVIVDGAAGIVEPVDSTTT